MTLFSSRTVLALAAVLWIAVARAAAPTEPVDGVCPKGFYCKLKLAGGEWCHSDQECLSGTCTTGVGCAFSPSGGDSTDYCLVDDDCDFGWQCSNTTNVCFSNANTKNVETSNDPSNEDATDHDDGTLTTGAIAAVVIAVLAAVAAAVALMVLAARKKAAAAAAAAREEEDDDGKKDDETEDEASAVEAGRPFEAI